MFINATQKRKINEARKAISVYTRKRMRMPVCINATGALIVIICAVYFLHGIWSYLMIVAAIVVFYYNVNSSLYKIRRSITKIIAEEVAEKEKRKNLG